MESRVAALTKTLLPHSIAVCVTCRREVPQAPGRVPAGVPPALLLHWRAAPLWARCVQADVQHRQGAVGPVCAGPPPDAPGSGGKDAGKGEALCCSGIAIYRLHAVSLLLGAEAALPALIKQRLFTDWMCVRLCFSRPRSGPRWLRCGSTCSGGGLRSSWGSCAA